MSQIHDAPKILLEGTLKEDFSNGITIPKMQEAAEILGRTRESKEAKFLAAFCNYFMMSYKNCDYNIDTNGEKSLLERLSSFNLEIIFDVGANIGDWSLVAAQTQSKAKIYSFEIIENTYNQLKNNITMNDDKIIPNNFGLSSETGSINVFENLEESTRSSIIDYNIGASKITSCPVYSGDDFMQERNISKVDFLKIDTEGSENLVIDGFKNAMERKKINMIQFEYGQPNIKSKFLFIDFYQMLHNYGFVIGKIYPNGVVFSPYQYIHEDFVGPNFFACRSEMTNLIEAARGECEEFSFQKWGYR